MKRFLNLKALVLSFVLAMFFALPVSAQKSDDFFRVNDDFGGTRTVTYWTAVNGISNNGIGQSEAPVGSGLLILTAVGAGYAISRRKRNFKNGATLLLAFALLLGMTQCKKNAETINPVGNGVHITLRVDGGSRANVEPTGGGTYATVDFEDGDIIYVSNNNAYCGYLTYDGNLNQFGGDINPTSTDDYLHFYCLGGNGFTSTVSGNTATVNISNQASKYPVISYAPSTDKYSTSITEYSAKLLNYCSIMKFTTNNEDDINSQVLCITGMNNKVTVDFTKAASELESENHGFGFSVDGIDGGLIKMPTNNGSNERWAIVLPQNAIDEAGVSGSAYTANGHYTGSRPAMAKIERNEYLSVNALMIEMEGAFDLANDSYVGTANAVAHIFQSNAETSHTITIADGQKVYLHGVNMLVSGNAINCLGDAEIVLSGTNEINSQNSSSGAVDNAIIKVGPVNKTLTISGGGSLEVRTNYNGGWQGALIGSDKNGDCGNITITGGTIEAIAYMKSSGFNNSASFGAVIGAGSATSGRTSSCGNILITGGTITADTYMGSGAGIGSGTESSASTSTCGTITISGGNVTAKSNKGGAAIGSGSVNYYSATDVNYAGHSRCEGVVIEGANTVVNATSSSGTGTNDYAGAAIGTGNAGEVGYITINGGTVTASGAYTAAGMGAGRFRSTCGNITICGGTVTAQGGTNAAGIGTGRGKYKGLSTCGRIIITTGVTKVTATKGSGGNNCIGKGGYGTGSPGFCSCGTVTIGCTLDSEGNPVGGTTGEQSGTNGSYTYQP